MNKTPPEPGRPAPEKRAGYLPMSLLLVSIVVLVAIVYNILIFLKQQNITAMEESAKQYQQQAAGILTEDIRTVDQARQLAARITLEQRKWTAVLTDFVRTLPITNVVLASFVGNAEGKITAQLSSTDMATVANTVELLGANETFKNTFVPSVSIGLSLEKNNIITFPVIIDLSKSKPAPNNANTNSEKVKVNQ